MNYCSVIITTINGITIIINTDDVFVVITNEMDQSDTPTVEFKLIGIINNAAVTDDSTSEVYNVTQIRVIISIAFFCIMIEMASIIDILIKTKTLISTYDGISSYLNKQSEFESDYEDIGNATIIIYNFYEIRGTATVVPFFVFFDVFDFFRQAVDTSSLNIAVSIECDTIIIQIDQLVLHLPVQLSINADHCHIQVINEFCFVSFLELDAMV